MTTPQYTVSKTLPNRGYRGIPMTEVLKIMRHSEVEAFLGLSLKHTRCDRNESWDSPLKHAGSHEALPLRMSTNAMQDSSTLRRVLIQKQTRVKYACKADKGLQ